MYNPSGTVALTEQHGYKTTLRRRINIYRRAVPPAAVPLVFFAVKAYRYSAHVGPFVPGTQARTPRHQALTTRVTSQPKDPFPVGR